MSLQGGSMSFQETGPSAMKFRDHTVAPVSASIKMVLPDQLRPAALQALEAANVTGPSLYANMQIPDCLLGHSGLRCACDGSVGSAVKRLWHAQHC